MLKTIRKCGITIAVGLGACGSLHASCLPDRLDSQLKEAYPSWKVVELQDFESYDQELLREAHLDKCPGVAEGRFDGKHFSYAVTLFDKSNGLRQMLIVLDPSQKKNTADVHVISPPEPVSVLAIVSRRPPGDIESVDGKKLYLRNDGINLEVLESGVNVYYFADGKYRSVLVSD